MFHLTYFTASFYQPNGQPVTGELRAFLPTAIVMPDGSLVQPHEVTYPLVSGVATMPDGSPARIVATEVGIPKVRIPFKLVDSASGKSTDLGSALIPADDATVQLSSLLQGEVP